MGSLTFAIQNIFSRASRDLFVKNLNNFRVPFIDNKGVQPSSTAAVLIPLCDINNVPSLLYTMRSTKLMSYSGQISFPGGKTDNNETPTQTALRETQEEIGLSPEKMDIWGYGPKLPSLDFKILITPVIGCITHLKESDLNLNMNEVGKVLFVPLDDLCDPKNQFYYQYSKELKAPIFVAGENKIWGITAFMTHMVLSCLLSNDAYRSDWMKTKIEL